MNAENTVRSAAQALQDAISAAQAQGYVIEWPNSPVGLSGLAISQTAAVAEKALPFEVEADQIAPVAKSKK